MCEELGDVLFQVIFHSQVAKDEGSFTIDDVVQGICEKMVRRHPHVFGDAKVNGASGWSGSGTKSSPPRRTINQCLAALSWIK